MYKIARHTDWPADFNDTASTFNIGFIGSDSTTSKIYKAFLFAEKFRKLKKKKIKSLFFDKVEKIENVRMLYVNGNGTLDLNKIKAKISAEPVLLITEGYPFEETMINMMANSRRGRFEVNQTNMRKAGLVPDNSVSFFSSRSEESITNTKDLLTLIRDGEDVELDAQDLAVLVDEYNQMIEQIEQQKSEIAEQTEELEQLINQVQEKQRRIKEQREELRIKEGEINQSEVQLASILAKNLQQQRELEQTEKELKAEVASLDSIHLLLDLEKKNFEQELAIQDSLIRVKKQELAENEAIIKIQNKTLSFKNQQIEEQQFMIWVGVFILVSLLGFAFLIYRNYRNKKKANAQLESKNKIIAHQKAMVEEKNREVMDSINYAKRIQEAILPPPRIFQGALPNSFVLYKPKDIVAGDFYWLDRKGDEVIFAAADCTGHGVPGAMVSVVCNNAMNRAVREFGLTEPGAILNKTRELVVEQFGKSDEEVKDGMDIALCSLKGNQLKYAGANNALWIIRKGAEGVEEYKATKQPIGKVDNPLPFETHSIELNPGDTFYIFSDGYVDQFGGEKGKKFKTKAFKQLLLSIQEGPLEDQCSVIDESFEAWRGDLEQVDDVCIIGVRV